VPVRQPQLGAMRINEGDRNALEVMGNPFGHLSGLHGGIIAGVLVVIPLYARRRPDVFSSRAKFPHDLCFTASPVAYTSTNFSTFLRPSELVCGRFFCQLLDDGGRGVMVVHTYYGFTADKVVPAGVGEAVGRSSVRSSMIVTAFVCLMISLSVLWAVRQLQ